MIDKLQTILQHFLFMLSATCKNTNVSIASVACISLIRIYKLWLAPGNYFHFSKFNFPLILSFSYNIKHFGAFIILQKKELSNFSHSSTKLLFVLPAYFSSFQGLGLLCYNLSGTTIRNNLLLNFSLFWDSPLISGRFIMCTAITFCL